MTRTWAVARQMVAEGIRMRLALVFLLLLGLAVAVRVIRQRARLAATDTSSPDDPVP